MKRVVIWLTCLLSIIVVKTNCTATYASPPSWEYRQLWDCHQNIWIGTKGPKFDLRWINMQISQHECMRELAQYAMTNSDRPEVKQYSLDAIEQNNKQIEQLKTWRKEWSEK